MKKIIRLVTFLIMVTSTVAMAKQNSIDMDITFKNHGEKKIKPVHVTVPVGGEIDPNDPSKIDVPNKDIIEVLNPNQPNQDRLKFSIFKLDNHGHADMLIQSWSNKCPMASETPVNDNRDAQHLSVSNAAIFCGLKRESIAKGKKFNIVVPESGVVIATVRRTR